MKRFILNQVFLTAIVLTAVFMACDKDSEAKKHAGVAVGAAAENEIPKPISDQLKIITSMGAITLELLPEVAPKTVENFKKRAMEGFYEGIIFHRVIPDFMVQGGGFLPNMSQKPAKGAVINEADLAMSKGLMNTRGTISMALVPGDPHGASVQFFINVKNNPSLNFKAKTLKDFGYCPFGRVIQGMDVVDRISKVKTKTVNISGKPFSDVPVDTVTILSIEEVTGG